MAAAARRRGALRAPNCATIAIVAAAIGAQFAVQVQVSAAPSNLTDMQPARASARALCAVLHTAHNTHKFTPVRPVQG